MWSPSTVGVERGPFPKLWAKTAPIGLRQICLPVAASRRARYSVSSSEVPVKTASLWMTSCENALPKSERQAMTDAYALLAVASRETGHVEDYEWAMAGARERGVDLTGLQ